MLNRTTINYLRSLLKILLRLVIKICKATIDKNDIGAVKRQKYLFMLFCESIMSRKSNNQ